MATTAKRAGPGPTDTTLCVSGRYGPQLVRTKRKRWSAAAEALFLDALGASCNVRIAAEAAGFSANVIYGHRRSNPAFARRWQAALEQGYVRLELLLIQRATETLEGLTPDPDTPIPTITVKDAIAILATGRNGGGRARGGALPRARVRSLDEVRDSILAKLEAIERKRLAGEGKAGADA